MHADAPKTRKAGESRPCRKSCSHFGDWHTSAATATAYLKNVQHFVNPDTSARLSVSGDVAASFHADGVSVAGMAISTSLGPILSPLGLGAPKRDPFRGLSAGGFPGDDVGMCDRC